MQLKAGRLSTATPGPIRRVRVFCLTAKSCIEKWVARDFIGINHMKSLGKTELGIDSEESDNQRDSLLLKLLRTPHQPRPKRERVKGSSPASKGVSTKGSLGLK
jgi:hypothetical protein